MKIKVVISREYDTEGEDHSHLFDDIADPTSYALHLFAEDIDRMVANNAVTHGALVEVLP